MRERPIIMSAPQVRAILAGTMTQTRRAVKIRGLDFVGGGPRNGADWNDPSCWGFEDCNTGRNWALASGEGVDDVFSCPHGVPGDHLWVRETWRVMGESPEDTLDMFGRDDIQYRADRDESYIGKYRSPIHMPRWASRITLEITGVRVERLDELSANDAQAEGVASVDEFIRLWKTINHTWEPSTWVWVLQFQRV